MKIVVLAGGLSPERNVSLSTGTMVAEALRALGHRAGLIDMYFGLEGGGADESFFDAPISEAYKKVSRQAPDLEEVRRSRPGTPGQNRHGRNESALRQGFHLRRKRLDAPSGAARGCPLLRPPSFTPPSRSWPGSGACRCRSPSCWPRSRRTAAGAGCSNWAA